MKKKTSKKILFTIISSLVFSCPVFADTNSVSVSCPSTAPVGSPTICTISGHSSGAISGVSTTISVNNLAILKFTVDPSWYGDANDGQIVVTTDSNKQGTFTIGTISVQPETVGSTGSINLSNVVFSNNSFVEFSVSGASTSLTAVDSINPQGEEKKESGDEEHNEAASLESLKVLDYDIDFFSDKYTYSLNIPEEVSALNIIATPKDENSIVTISGNENLADGSVIKITVQNGEAKSIYRIKISTTKLLSTTKNDPGSNSVIIIALICGGAILITGILAIILFRKKKSKNSIQNTNSAIPPRPLHKDLTPFMQSAQAASAKTEAPQPDPKPVEISRPQPVASTPISTEPKMPSDTSVTPPTSNSNPFMTNTPSFNPFEGIEKPVQPTPQPSPIPTPTPNPTPRPRPIAPAPTPVNSAPRAPRDNQPISLDKIPFNQSPSGPQTKKPSTPIIFES